MKTFNPTASVLTGVLAALAAGLASAGDVLEEIVVWGQESAVRAGPSSAFAPADLAGATTVTTEDLLKFEPGVVIRRRFIGDANGTVGMRGANMFQTTRSMVFADGVPLHYLLQSRWNGAPRWSMISASEIDRVEVLYGPFSAEYGGNAMGGVILMESSIPQRREFHFDSTFFVQDFSAYGFDDALQGRKTFLSYGDRFGPTSLYLSYNRLDSESQPQLFFTGAAPVAGEPVPAQGALASHDENGRQVFVFGDSGAIDSATENYKLKLGFDAERWSALLNLVYERRAADSLSPASYMRGAGGETLWSGNALQDGQAFSLPAARLGLGLSRRESLSGGLRLKHWLGDALTLESTLSWFGILRDENRVSARHPLDPAYTPAGEITAFGHTGWRTAEVKLANESLLDGSAGLAAGLRHEDYALNLEVHDSDDWIAGARGKLNAASGGATTLDAAFVQFNWAPGARWDLALGARLESWRSGGGHVLGRDGRREAVPARAATRLSPKLSLGFAPADDWTLRYSLARAWRFPIVEELFSQYEAYNSVNRANPDLAPENGLHHNLAVQRFLANGELTLNLFDERVRDVIEAQSTTLPGGVSLRTFLPVGEVRTSGAEFIANVEGFLLDRLDLRFNLAWTHSRIARNPLDPTLEGKDYPRLPRWRTHLLLDYGLSDSLSLGAGLRHASSSYGRLDNADSAHGVFGAQDGYLFVDFRADWQAREGLRLGLGVDNVFDRRAWVSHPWPGRTLFLEARLSL